MAKSPSLRVGVCFFPTLHSTCAIQRQVFYLTVSPSEPTVNSGGNMEITAYLQSRSPRGGLYPEPDRTIKFETTVGHQYPNKTLTNSQGKATVTYFAPQVSNRTSGTITTIFTGGYARRTAKTSVYVKPGLSDVLPVPWYVLVEITVGIIVLISCAKIYL